MMNFNIRPSRLVLSALVQTALIFLFLTNASAQFDTATVLGSVRDANGAALQGANITLKNVATSITNTTTSDSNGDYQFTNVKIGNYQVIVEANGFSRTIADNINVTVNARQRVDLSLQVATANETVTITDAATPLQTDSSEVGQVIQRKQIVALPLNGRSYANLALLAPGVRESSTNSSIGGGGREAAFNVNGLRATMNNFLLDGIDNNAYGTSNQSFSSQVVQVSPDAVAEFKVQTNTYSAEFGRSGGAVINASYRSGTNQFHGSLWEFHRNKVLNATGFFKPIGGKPPLIRNQFGFVFGGPIIKDRTFFFGDYEGFRQVQKNLTYSITPTLAQRAGILSVAVRNPLTGQTYAAGTPIPMTAFARKVLNDLPAPNLTGQGASNYQNLVLNQNFSDKYNVRIDHKFNDLFSIFGRWSYRKSDEINAPNIEGTSGGGSNGFVNVVNKQLTLGGTYAFSSGSVLDARFSLSSTNAGKEPVFLGQGTMQSLYGISGLPEDPTISGGLNTQTITGYAGLGRQATNPQYQNPTNQDYRISYSTIFGKHSVKIGYEYLRVQTDVQDTNPLYGLDTYSGQFSRVAGGASNLYNLADFMFGLRAQYELANLTVAEMQQRFHYAYIQDDWKVNRKLTLNLGLRYEFGTPYFEKNNRLSNYDPTSNSILLAKDGSLYDRTLVDPDYNNFGPRLGFAYNVFNKTVFRGGYGVGYNYLNRLGSADVLGTNAPIITRAAISQSPFLTVNGVETVLPTCTGNNFANCYRPTQSGYPSISNLPNNVTLYVPRDIKTPMIQNWQLSVQQEIFKEFVLDVAYVGNKAKNLVILADLNQARVPLPGENVQGTLQARRPIQGFGSISAVLPEGFSNYNALQVKLEKRFSKGLYLLNSFTWSKAIDNASQVLEEPNGNTGNPQNVYDIAADKGIGAYDQPFNNTTSFVYEVPIGRGRWLGSNLHPVVDAFIGGWMLNGINTMTSGQPITFRYSPSPVTNNLPTFLGGTSLRPNITCDPTNRGSRANPIRDYFNFACVSIPPVTAPFGNAGRNIARSDKYFNFDFGLQKQFKLPFNEETRIEFRAEFFNLFNKTNFQAANSNANNITRTPDGAGGFINTGNFGLISNTFPARQVQLALKFYF